MNKNKTVVYHPAGALSAADTQILTQAQLPLVNNNIIEVLGAAITSSDELMAEWAARQVKNQEQMLQLLQHPDMPRQIGMALLRVSAVPRMNYVQRVTKPSSVTEAMNQWQHMLEQVYFKIADIS